MIELAYAEFMLGEKVYKVRALGLDDSEKWRALFQDEAVKLLSVIQKQGESLADLENFKDILQQDLIQFLPVISDLFIRVNGSMSILAELICSYGDKLQGDAAYIRKEASMAQALAALVEMVKLEYPFGTIFRQQTGRPEGSTLKN